MPITATPPMLAQDSTTAEQSMVDLARTTVDRMDILHHPQELIDRLAEIPLVMAGVLVVVGTLCVLNGYRWHKWVVVVLAFLGGIILGNMLSEQMGRSNIVAAALGLLCAVVATPLLKLAVAIFAGLTGAFVGANCWTAFNDTMPEAHWAGAAMGFIILAMASFILFKLVIMLFTSIGGAAMVVFGGITLLLHVESWETGIRDGCGKTPSCFGRAPTPWRRM